MEELKILEARTIHDMKGILKLQNENLKINLNSAEALKEGFVTCVHDLDLIQTMNSPFPHTIVKEKDQVVGYALTMLPEMRNKIKVLIPMFELLDECILDGLPMASMDYFVMGQICIAKECRGIGLFRKLYDHQIKRLSGPYDYVVTEVANENKRSLGAHLNYGFEELKIYNDKSTEWVVMVKKISIN